MVELSFYTKKYENKFDPETLILYSTKTSALIVIPNETFQRLEEGKLSPEDERLLTELGFLVEDREKEREYMINIFDLLETPYVETIFVLNRDCNFSCKYCFEANIKESVYMSQKVLNQSIEFINRELEKGAKALLIGLYGGEPLLKPRLTKEVLVRAKELCEKFKIELKATLVTNGSLMKKELVKELTQLGLKKVRITLDGPPQIHNYFRPFKNGKESFHIILSNIKECASVLKELEVAGNYSKETYKEFPKLLDILLEEGLGPDRVASIRFEPIIKQPSGISIYKGGCSSINEAWVSEAALFLREQILKRGYKAKRIEPIFCMVNSKRSFVIDTDGSIYKCPGFLGIEKFKIGDVFQGVKDASPYNLNRWKNKECMSCVYLPLCYGGCRYMSYLRFGNLEKLDCQKPFFEKNLYKFIEQELRFKIG